MKCSKCGGDNPDRSNFCRLYGAKLTAMTPREKWPKLNLISKDVRNPKWSFAYLIFWLTMLILSFYGIMGGCALIDIGIYNTIVTPTGNGPFQLSGGIIILVSIILLWVFFCKIIKHKKRKRVSVSKHLHCKCKQWNL